MNNNPTISVLMSVYNDEKFLAQAIESILKQTYSNFEFIIVNDGSTDNSTAILEDYQSRDNRIRLIQQENMGLPTALNNAFAVSRGTYIARMDGDDISTTERFARQLKYLEEHPSIDLVGCQLNYMDEYGKNIGKTIQNPLSHNRIKKYISYATPIAHPTFFMKREVMTTLNDYRDFFAMEDYDFLLRAVEQGYILANLNRPLVNYRVNPLGISRRYIIQQYINTKKAYLLYKQRLRSRSESARILKELTCKKYSPPSHVYKLHFYSISIFKNTRNLLMKIIALIMVFCTCMLSLSLIARFKDIILTRLIVKHEQKFLQRGES